MGDRVVCGGVDVGSSTAKAVLVDDEGRMLAFCCVPTGFDHRESSLRCYEGALRLAGCGADSVRRIVATGYGRRNVAFARSQVSEISCHGRGAHHLFPETRTVIDVGGQDSKAIRVSGGGRAVDFAMNDKCAAGTGRFLEVTARSVGVPYEELGNLYRASRREVRVGSLCTVFAETEIISLIAAGEDKADIVRGLHAAVADRVASLAQRVGWEPQVTLTGGVARNLGAVDALAERLGVCPNVPEEPQIVGALGAALLALDAERAGEAS